MDPQKPPLVDHPTQQHLQPLLPHHHQHQQPPPQSHGIMAPAVHVHGIMAQPLNLPPQPHQQEKPNSILLNNNNNDFFRAKVIFHQPQQQNLQSPLNSVSGQYQKFNLDHPDGPTIAGISAEPSKKKRGRPRKYSADGSIGLGTTPTPVAQSHSTANPVNPGIASPNDVASSENPSKKGHGRPPESRKQKQQRETLGDVGFGFMHHLINVNIGEDIASKVMNFLQQTPRAVCILSAIGVVCKVTLLKFAGGGTMTYKDIASKVMNFLQQTPRAVCILSAIGVVCKVTLLKFAGGGTMTYKGRFVIASLSGSFLLSKSNGSHRRTGGLTVSLNTPDGKVFGGVIAGTLTAATPVQVNVVSFVEDEEKPNSEAPSLTPPDSVTEASSPSPDATSDSAAQLMRGIPGQTM